MTKKAEFIDFYRQLCEEYGMIVTAWYGEAPSETGTHIDDVASQEEIDEHIKEINE